MEVTLANKYLSFNSEAIAEFKIIASNCLKLAKLGRGSQDLIYR